MLLSLLLATSLFSQAPAPKLAQTIRGMVVDADSRSPLMGATVIVLGSDPLLGITTDLDGQFRLREVPVGRVALQVSFLGYESSTLPNILVNAGKETVLTIPLAESTLELQEVVVRAGATNGKPVNEMALVSARAISTEEISRLTASFNDPARITANFAGVSNTANGGNDIIVRGNSPKFMQWRLEGAPITNPNHFADQNAVLGSTGILNANLLATSDFYTGAFPAEYGNLLSGVYDIRLRNGNNEKFEGIAGIGLIGTELTLEGPFRKGYGGSFLVNYRYSTASILTQLDMLDVNGDPQFQDAAFKLNLPTQKLGLFSLFGLAGHSTFAMKNVTLDERDIPGDDIMNGTVFEDYDKTSYLLNTGLNHTLPVGGNGFLKSSLSYSLEGIDDDVWRKPDSLSAGTPSFVSRRRQHTYRAATTYHHKLNARNSLKAGAIYTFFQQDFRQQQSVTSDSPLAALLDFDEGLGNLRGFVSWKHRLNDAVTMVAGLHTNNVFFNDKHTLEPRLSACWQTSPNGALSLGYGLHSAMEGVHHYFADIEQEDGSVTQPNLDLGLLKAHHFVLGYDHYFTPQLMAKVEVYYQYLYNLPVANEPGSYFATINEGADIAYFDLANEGTGRNYGLELTLQRFFADGYYFLANASIFESTYKGLDGVERNTRFNSNYMANLIGGKEFEGLGKKQNRTFGINARLSFAGGQPIIPLLRDEAGSPAVDPAGNQYWDYDRAFETSLDDLYQLTISASYRMERKQATHELFLNLQNITNAQGRLTEYYDANEPGSVGYSTQFGLFPNFMYRVYF